MPSGSVWQLILQFDAIYNTVEFKTNRTSAAAAAVFFSVILANKKGLIYIALGVCALYILDRCHLDFLFSTLIP